MPSKRHRYLLLLLTPLSCLALSIIYAIAAWELPYHYAHIGFGFVSVSGFVIAFWMFRNNIKRGWGWHGQRWPQ